jgi:HK97 family phage major capsid protein
MKTKKPAEKAPPAADERTADIPQSLEDLKGQTPEELRDIVTVLDAHLRSLHQTDAGELRDLAEEEEAAFDLGMEIREKAIDMLDKHDKIRQIFNRQPAAVAKAFNNIRGVDPSTDITRMTVSEARDHALRMLDSSGSSHLEADQKDQVEKQVRKSTDIARRVLVTENEDYRSAWVKMMTQGHPFLSDEENQAMRSWEEYRAASEGTGSAGGYGIPVFIDPSIILTAQGSGNPFLEIARTVDVNTNAWKGVTSAGVSWSFNAEGSAVADNAPTLAQPTVTVFMARGFIPFSIELGEDYPSFAEEMATLLAAGYDELLVDKFSRGSGTGEPMGVLTELSANSAVRVPLAAGGTVGASDPYNVWSKVPQRFRRKASWLMSVDVNNAIRELATANVYHALTVTLPEEWADTLFKKPVYESPYMPDHTTSSTATSGLAVVGDFSNYLIARRGGMSTELVPQLFDVTFNRPTGQRGWFAYARIGGGPVNDNAFRLLTNA